jgi:hypothetical protein
VALLAKIEYAGANESSFEQAAEALRRLAETPISAKHVQRITGRLGGERTQEREGDVERLKEGKLAPKRVEPPAVAAIHLDAGKVQLRAEDGGPGVRHPRWADTKVGCFLTYAPPKGDSDPQPEPPALFLDPPEVMRLCQEMNEVRGDPTTRPTAPKLRKRSPTPSRAHPKRLVRTAVATTQGTEAFGWIVAAEAMRRGFYEAPRRALVGDGGNWIEPLGQMHFPAWVQVLDFLHLLTHLHAAATAAYPRDGRRAWNLYSRMLRAAWAGQTQRVRSVLHCELERLGPPSSDAPADAPAKVVARTLAYVEKNAQRMNYPHYRREGLPVTSAAVESLIKQFNRRIKGTEKFWRQGGVESVLQSRAAYLSDDGRGEAFYSRRPRTRAAGSHRLRPAA